MACPRLDDVRQLVGVDRSETLAVLDGNVMVMAVPQSDDDPSRVRADPRRADHARGPGGGHTLSWSSTSPSAMTRAKQAEQRLRDAKRTSKTPVCSDELVACITTDEFTEEMLYADGCNVRMLMDHRKARPRFFDALCVAVRDHFLDNTSGAGVEPHVRRDRRARREPRVRRAARGGRPSSTDDAFWAPAARARDGHRGGRHQAHGRVSARARRGQARGVARARRRPQPPGDGRHRLARDRAAQAADAPRSASTRPTATS